MGVLGVCELDNSRAIDEGNIQLSRNKSVIQNRQYSTSPLCDSPKMFGD